MSSQESKAQTVKDFMEVFPDLVEEFLREVRTRNFPEEAVQWIKKSFDHNIQGGKMNRGLSVVDTLKILQNDQLTAEELFKSRVLGWCIEWLQAFFLVADDIMDASITRRGNPCWYKMEGVDSYYVDLVELFHEITLETELGQLLDLTTAPEDHVDLSKFSIEKHRFIVLYKTAFYSFYLPVALAMHMAGIKNEKAFKAAKDILLPLGEYFQIQDDYLDCYGDPEVIGKIGTDIEDNKCSWLINQALAKVSPEQRKLLDENYGRKNPKNVAVVKQIYKDLEIEKLYKEYEEQSYSRLNDLILQLDDSLIKRQVFYTFMDRIYKRTK
ncbi:farnesyl pyrophosphate synthase [Rhizophagus irregularis DAOM 181602=DAOM 197198]|nr:farnesyl pyrophosphate synthase [Rhizophagus irregularis DAOM 181602=DAOM 197198]